MSKREVTLALARLISAHDTPETLAIIPKLKHLREHKPDFSALNCVKIAVKVDYDGEEFQGLAFQTSERQLLTVENLFLESLRTNFLVPRDCIPLAFKFSRSGRTDSGVSGVGQVFSFYVRCNFKSGITFGELIKRLQDRQPRNEDESEDLDLANRYAPTPAPQEYEGLSNMNYIEMFNKALPQAIRARQWSFVPETFDARFSSKSRYYRYYLPKIATLEKLIEITRIFVGTKDFRNFCCKKPEVTNHVRTVFSIDITDQGEYFLVKIHGSAFLYHQIRCIIATTSLCAIGKLTQEFLAQMFEMPEKPFYPLAPACLLCFFGVEYDEKWELKWKGNLEEKYNERDARHNGELDTLEKVKIWRGQGGDVNAWFLQEIGINDSRVGKPVVK